MLDRQPAAQELPLGQAQLGIWRGQKLAGEDSAIYNAAEALEILGPLDAECFLQALQLAFDEADALNRVIVELGEQAVQRAIEAEVDCPYIDLSNAAASGESARQWMQAQTQKPFALMQHLYRNAIIKIAPDRHYWYLCIHHVVCDGFGFALLQQRVCDLYNQLMGDATLRNRPALGPLQPLLTEDALYQSSAARQVDKQYWLQQLSHMDTPVSLSTSQAPVQRPALRVQVQLPPKLKQRLNGIHGQPALNWSHTIIAAIVFCIYRRTNTPEVVLGLPVMGRMQSAALRVPAMVMNIVPLRIRLQEPTTFAQLTEQVAQLLQQQRKYQRYRYEHLRRDLGLVGGGQKLFGPVVNIMPFDRQLFLHGLPAKPITLRAGPVEDLAFSFVVNNNGGLTFTIEANPDRYSNDELAHIQNEVHHLLASCSAEQQLEPAPEYLSLLQGAQPNEPVVDVLALIEQAAHERSEHPALLDATGTLNYRQLWLQLENAAAVLQAYGVHPGDLVAVCLPRGCSAIVALLAVLRCQAGFVCLDPQGPDQRNATILRKAQPALVVSEQLHSWFPSDGCTTLLLGDLLTNKKKGALQIPLHSADAALPAYVIFTSGSTGEPKGVAVGRRALNEFVASAQQIYRLTPRDRMLQFAPLIFDACIEEIFLTLCRGATLVLRDDDMLQSMQTFLQSCEQQRLTILDLPTAFWHELVHYLHQAQAPWPACVHSVIIGGEAAQPKRVAQWFAQVPAEVVLWNTYGPSEATVVATSCRLLPGGKVTIGAPLPGRTVVVVDQQGRAVARGRDGELALAGSSLACGYLHQPEQTANAFGSLLLPGLGNRRCYKTGDCARINSAGEVEYLGRMDDEIKISGQRIHPAEIEAAIIATGQVQACAVVAVNMAGNKQLRAFMSAAHAIDISALKKQLRNTLNPLMIPAVMQQLDALPLNAAGKVDKKNLQQQLVDEPAANATLSGEQALVKRIWQEVLGLNNIAPADDFFLLGGQSLQTIAVANRLTAELGRQVSVATLFEYPTLAGLADHLADKLPQTATLSTKQQLLADAELDDDLWPHTAQVKAGPWQCILLTGASGFVGAQLLAQLCTHSSAKIFCLVRGQSMEQGRQKIMHALNKQNLPIGILQRVQVVLGDLEAQRLGLTDQDWLALQDRVDVIFHNAAITSVLRDYESLKHSNTLSCHTLLDLARKHNVPLHLVSTIAVGQGCKQLPERVIDYHPGLADGYQQSKWAAERILHNAKQRGFNVAIYRLARVVGSIDNGYVNPRDLMWNILRASLAVNALPKLAVAEPWTPVDTVCQTIVLGAKHQRMGGVFNLSPSSLVTLSDLGRWADNRGAELKSASLADWLTKLAQTGTADDQALLAFFQQREGQAAHGLADIVNAQTQRLLAACKLSFAPIDERVFQHYFNNALEQGLLRVVSHQEPNDELTC